MEEQFKQHAQALVDAGHALSAWGMVPATSGNLSARLDDGNIVITVSGKHKGKLTVDDLMLIDADGNSLDGRRSSAETLLHTQVYRRHPEINAVLHPHSINAVLLSRYVEGPIALQGYELLKALSGISTHATSISLPVFENDQDIQRLAAVVDGYMDTHDPIHGYLINGHGFYAWGKTVDDALRHVEALDFLFACELKSLQLR